MISDRIKKLVERIQKATEGDDYGLYIVTLRNGVYTCNDPVMTCTSEAEFIKWKDTLKKNRTIITDDLEDDDDAMVLVIGRRPDGREEL